MTTLKQDYLETIFDFKKLINTEFGRGKSDSLSLTDLLMLEGIKNGESSIELSNRLNLTKAAVSQNTTSLEKRNLITRTINPENRRNVILKISEKGNRLVQQTNNSFDDAFAKFVSEMGESDLETLLSLMKQMSTIIGK